MRVSEYYKLDRRQPSIDFVDVDIIGDVRLFVDPRALLFLRSEWGDECVSLVQNFFKTVLLAIHNSRDDDAQKLLQSLKEPNETHLGLSRGRARGRALGHESARNVWLALSRSEAVHNGLLENLEDTILMVEGIASDIVSDIVTNIIREPLINYTRGVCEAYGIQMEDQVASGPLWDPAKREWFQQYVPLPVANDKKLILVPKVIIRQRMSYDADEYYRHYILEDLRQQELSANTGLVELLKTGRRRVTKKALIAKYGQGKKAIIRETLRNPRLLERYRSDKRLDIQPPLSHEALAEAKGEESPDWQELLSAVLQVVPGKKEAYIYEDKVEQYISALFYPFLANPQIQHEIHEGRKRIDITYTNVANVGFFGWLSKNYSAAHIFVECKNFGREIGNPELDQLAGRFSPSRGQVGILICRSFKDKDHFLKRCRDTALDRRGFILPLDDDDLKTLADSGMRNTEATFFEVLKKRFDNLIM